MPFDAHKNLAIATVATPPSPASSGTSLTVAAGLGARFPAAPFNATIWPATAIPDPANAEVVRVTAVTGDGLTITRAQEATTARAIVAGDLIAATITAKTLTDLESGTNFPQIATPIVTTGDVVLTGPTIRRSTIDGADTELTAICGGGANSPDRGAMLRLFGNEHAAAGGVLTFFAGPAGSIQFYTGNTQLRGMFLQNGGFNFSGNAYDPGPNNVLIGGPFLTGYQFVLLDPLGTVKTGAATTAATPAAQFLNPNGIVGSISTAASATAFNTTSDARLKMDRGPRTDLEVLRRTVIHDFTWAADGTPGRGVFAQEAIAVAPFAVTVGTDETDNTGRLTTPWGVDYAKYVPDLIVGWQAHDAKVLALEATIERLEATVAALVARLG